MNASSQPGGYSDKYGHVRVERFRNPIAPEEPVALFPAHDVLAIPVLEFYLARCESEGCDPAHIASVKRQLANFHAWRADHAPRRPGDPEPARDESVTSER